MVLRKRNLAMAIALASSSLSLSVMANESISGVNTSGDSTYGDSTYGDSTYGDSTYGDSTSGDKLEETMVWGTEVKSSSLYLGEQDIAVKQADHLSDILRTIPGVDIGGTHSVNTRINVRGLDDRDLAIYIDGVLQTNYLYHHMGNLLINPDILKSADIAVGANSVTNGGLGGTVRFETKDAKDLLKSGSQFGGRVFAGVHSNAQTSASVTGFGQLTESLDALLYVNSVNRDNFEDGSGQEIIGADGSTTNILAKIGYDFGSSQRLEFSADIYSDAGDYGQRPDMGYQAASGLSGALEIPLFDTEYDRQTYNLGYEAQFGVTQVDANLYYNGMTLYRDESAGLVSPFGDVVPSTEKESTASNFGFFVLASTQLKNNTLRYGVEHFNQSYEMDSDLTSSDDAIQEQNAVTTAFFIEDEIELGKFTLTPGVRLTEYQYEVDNTGLDRDWSEPTFALAAEYRVNQRLEFTAGFTELFKGPELAEAFQGTGAILVDNPELDAETGDNLELGLRSTLISSEGVTLRFGVNAYSTTIDNYITQQSVDAESANVHYVNSGTAVIEGFESSFDLDMGSLDILLTFSRADLKEDDLEVNDTTESLREVGDSLTLDVGTELTDEFSINYSFLNVYSQSRAFGGEPKPGYAVHNVALSYEPKIVEGLTVFAGIDNVFDKEYTAHASREGIAPFTTPPTVLNDVEPGRNLKLSIAYSF